jgi:tetratricopeptide (TPR) repeat protein
MKFIRYYLQIFLFFLSVFAQAQTLENKIYNQFLQKQYSKILETIEESDTFNADDFYYAGLSAEMFEDATLSAIYFKKCVALDSTHVPAKIGLAKSLFQNEEFVNAAEIYANLLETDTLNDFLWGSLGDCYAKLSLMPLAYSCYQNAFYLNPKNSANTLKLVNSLVTLKNENYIPESLFYCDSSLIYNDNNKPLLRKKASLYFINHEYLKAMPILDSLLCKKDSSYMVLKYAGICHALFKTDNILYKNATIAIQLLRKAHQQNPTDKEVMLHLAAVLSHKPEFFDEAVELISKIRKTAEPDSAVIYQTNTLLAQSYLSIKDTVNAIQQYYYSMNSENKEDRLLRMTSLASNVRAETTETLLWYVHYFFLQNFKPEYERNWNFLRQQSFSINLMEEFIRYMHKTGQKRVSWQTIKKKTKTITMDDLRKIQK